MCRTRLQDEGQIVDGMEAERFQVRAVLLAICKVNLSPRDVQCNGWSFESLARKVLYVFPLTIHIPDSLLKKDPYDERYDKNRNEQDLLRMRPGGVCLLCLRSRPMAICGKPPRNLVRDAHSL
jgi:hypothetical protein